MVPKPIGDNAQKQRLTIALKNICRDYPAGGGVLRELLQNADDAGATVVRFHLDERVHPTSELIAPALAKYQGPALLAYNDAIFTQNDFQNLSRLGDSLKLQDGLTTGKFGRGFNSVYNWTDSPAIVSLERLLILDPHEEWSTGGPLYDFVADAEDQAIQNHMAAFQSVMDNPAQPFKGTIIRIPLRTQDQALESDISSRETTALEVREVLNKFATEFGNSGLLFMRNIEKVAIDSTTGISISIEIVDREELREHKSRVNHAVKLALAEPGYTFDHSFEVKIECRSDQESSETCFVVHHTIRGDSMDSHMRKWTRDQKLVPWAAVAAQFPFSETTQGSLFTVLPLPITINQPVLVHGLFSVSPDRARLYQLKEDSTQDQFPAKWNEWLLHGPVPMAWTKLLSHLAHLHSDQSIFEWWPQDIDSFHDILSDALDDVLDIITKESLQLWSTDVGYVSAMDGLLNIGKKPIALRSALREAKIPVIYAPDRLRRRVEHLFNGKILGPQRLSIFLMNKNNQIKDWRLPTKMAILEYIMSESGNIEYGSIELFPFKDGKYRSIADHVAFVHRNESEIDLFNLQNDHNIDFDKVSDATSSILKDGCKRLTLHKSIRHRSANDFRDYCLNFVFPKIEEEQDLVSLDAEAADFVSKAWVWILKQRINVNIISDLWLVPMTNGRHRKIVPRHSTSETIFAPVGPMGDLIMTFWGEYSSKIKPLLDTGPTGLSPRAREYLMTNSRIYPNLLIRDGGDIVDFTQWLYQIQAVVNSASDEEKDKVVQTIALNLPTPLPQSKHHAIANAIGALEIFKKVSWKVEGDKMILTSVWTSLKASDLSISLLDGLIAVPLIRNVQFLDTPLSSLSLKLLNELNLATCLKTVQIIDKYIIPNWNLLEASNGSYSSRRQLATVVFSQYSCLSLASRDKLRALPVVPVARINGEAASKFSVAADLIHPSILDLKDLFFDDEEVVPESKFLKRFSACLWDIGLRDAVDETLVSSRTRYYASSNRPVSEVKRRVHKLLASPCRWGSLASNYEDPELRRLKWLPVINHEKHLGLRSPNQCRGLRDRLLAGSQLLIFDISVSLEWETLLGWRDVLPKQVLLGQLNHGLRTEDREVVDAILTYIVKKAQTELLINDLRRLPCILTSTGLYVTASKAFHPPINLSDGCDRLHPYLGNVDNKFWHDHKKLLTEMIIRERPSPDDLLGIQKILESQLPLSESDVAVAIEILRLASKFPRTSLAGLKVLSKDGDFCQVQEINYNDLGVLTPTEEVKLTHPNVPSITVERLGIELLSERLKKGMLEIADIDDEDEFEQQEQIETRIVDTLGRYPIDNTFKEYLANADDTAGASKLSWLLDRRTHPGEKLLTPELRTLQGPALVVYNDGVFSHDDFQGFKNVGEGSKRDKKETIGQFGRGSQTMYHWTDVPMILSGRYLVILDPQQNVLPKNQIKGKRKPGVKLELSKLKDICPDQLAPFEGLWGYNRDLDNYPGTIFRFPLRTGTTHSKLRVRKIDLDSDMVRKRLEKYFDEARISLLFLRRIRSIDFKVDGEADCEWSVTKQEPLNDDPPCFSQWAWCSFTKSMVSGHQVIGKDKWWVAIEDLLPKTDKLPYSPSRTMKNVECGIAGLVLSKVDTNDPDIAPPEVMRPCMFSTLPLPILSDLPIYIHATFSLSGDRRSLIIDEHGLESHGSEWNKYLLQSALPELYLSFLDDIGRHVRHDVFRFWPQEDPPRRSCSELLCSSFWEKLPKSSGRFFPKAQLVSILDQRRPPTLFDIRQATFDFLPKTQSDILAPLLLSMDMNLVRNIPEIIAKHLEKLPEVNSVTGQMLRMLFKSERNKLCLQKEMSKNRHILDYLLFKVIPVGDDFEELDGCHILPLADGTLATLRLLRPSAVQTNYYFASEDEKKLFAFASELLISPKTGKLFEKNLSCEKFNVERLQLRHVSKLLEGRTVPKLVTSETDEWLTKFWNYWNKSSEATTSSSKIDIDGLPGVFKATCRTTGFYFQPLWLRSLPAVVEPSVAEHQELCGKFPGLWRFDNKFMPKDLRESESSFGKSTSFFRFIRALRDLAIKDGKTLGDFVKMQLTIDDLKMLRRLFVHHTPGKINAAQPESQEFVHLKADIRSIPLWPSINSATAEMISANNALIAENRGFLVPWMKQYQQFIDPQLAYDPSNQDCIQILGIQKVSAVSLLDSYLLPLPPMSSTRNWLYYKQLIAAVSSFCEPSDKSYTVQSNLSQNKIAVDGNRSLRRADELFDHEDPIFISAFRGQEGLKFLHSEVKAFRQFWLKVRLLHRQNGILNPGDYLQCLRSMSQRLSTDNFMSNTNLASDTHIVLSPLITPSSSTQNFSHSDWSSISKERVFVSSSIFIDQPEYRRVPMHLVAIDRPLLALSEVISYSHVEICWSQTPFTDHTPTTEVFSFIQGGGKPSVNMVWRHLDHLHDMAPHLTQEHIRDFLHDLHCTYAYLQDHTEESRMYFNHHRNAVWLNISSSEGEHACLTDVRSSWNEIGDLVLSSSCDAGRIKAVRPSLMRYEKLLRALGCKSIVYPTVTRPVLHHAYSISASLRKLRAEKKLLDITYLTEGKEIQAHRVVLAAVSEKCASQWSGLFPMEDKISYDQDRDLDCFLSYHTLSTMINYAYESDVDWREMEASDEDDEETREDKLYMLLDLHKGAQYWLIPPLMSEVEDRILVAGKVFINIENVVAVRQRADYVGAKAVAKMCTQFIEQNRDAVERAKSGTLD